MSDWIAAVPEDIWVFLVHRRKVPAFCHNCGLEVEYDHDSGYWIHRGYKKVDGQNGLYCSPGMWDGTVPRVYAKPVRFGTSRDT